MNETMGQIIRRLRKERKLTQEELAELLGVTFQAVSKWENDTGMPDISQVIPLATVFGVSTDVLFGIQGQCNEKEVLEIIECAYSMVTRPATKQKVKACYDELQKGLKKFPNDLMLLCQCLEMGIALAYPENDTYDAENGDLIYQECIREANLVIKYDRNTTSVLRAHMIMALLHAAYGNFEQAKDHANKFPWRADMTEHNMNAFIAHLAKDFKAENQHHQENLFMQMEAMIDTLVGIGCSHNQLGEYEKASEAFRKALSLIDLVCNHEPALQRLHRRERGDIYILLAESCLKQGLNEEALTALEKMVNHDLLGFPCKDGVVQIPAWLREQLKTKLHNPSFDVFCDEERFANLFSIVGL